MSMKALFFLCGKILVYEWSTYLCNFLDNVFCKVFVKVEIEGNRNGMIWVGLGLSTWYCGLRWGVSCGGGSWLWDLGSIWAIEFIYVRWPQAVPAHAHLITFTLRLDILQTNRDGGKIIKGKRWIHLESSWTHLVRWKNSARKSAIPLRPHCQSGLAISISLARGK